MTTSTELPLLDAALAAFIQGPLSIIAASRDELRVPSLARTLGCWVSADRHTVALLLAASQSAALLADLRRGAPIAAVFCLPSTHQTIQLKAPGAEVAPPGSQALGLKDRYTAAFIAELERVGDSIPFSHAYLACDLRDLVEVRFAPTAAFRQTPGPGAGAPLSPAG
jgi:hypothetical protein